MNVPNTIVGWQLDCSNGAAYAALWAFNTGFPNAGRECIQVKISDTLKQYRKYVASMQVSLCNYCNYAVSSMGMYFSNNAVMSSNMPLGTYINVVPQVKSKVVLMDTLNWMTVQDTFIAQGGELYLTIGNFNPDSLSDTLLLPNRSVSGSYYYIDSVTVFDTGLTGLPEMGNEKNEVKIFPNPNNGNFEIEHDFTIAALLEIRDLQGRLIEKKNLPPRPGPNEH